MLINHDGWNYFLHITTHLSLSRGMLALCHLWVSHKKRGRSVAECVFLGEIIVGANISGMSVKFPYGDNPFTSQGVGERAKESDAPSRQALTHGAPNTRPLVDEIHGKRFFPSPLCNAWQATETRKKLQNLVERVKNENLEVPIAAHALLAAATLRDMQQTLMVYQELDNLLNDNTGAKNVLGLHLYKNVKELLGGPEPKNSESHHNYDDEYFGKKENIPKQFWNVITEPDAQKLSNANLPCWNLSEKLDPFFIEQTAKLRDKCSDEDTKSQAFDELNYAIWEGQYPGKKEGVLKNPERFIAKSYSAMSLALGLIGTHISIVKRQIEQRPELQTVENQEEIQETDRAYELTCLIMDKAYDSFKNKTTFKRESRLTHAFLSELPDSSTANLGRTGSPAIDASGPVGPMQEPDIEARKEQPSADFSSPAKTKVHSNALQKNKSALGHHPGITSFLEERALRKRSSPKDDVSSSADPEVSSGNLESDPSGHSKSGNSKIDRFFRKIRSWVMRSTSASPSAVRDLGDVELASLITRFGGAIETAWMDHKYSIFTVPDFDNAVGYIKHDKCAIVLGEPVCEKSNQEALTKAFETMCKENNLTPVYSATGRNFAYAVGNRDGHYVQALEEEILNPASDEEKTSKSAMRSIRQAEKNGVSVEEYSRPEGNDPAFANFQEECNDLIGKWLEKKKGKMHATDVEPFVDGTETRWFTARKEGKLAGLVVLTKLDSQEGYFIAYNITADAPSGTSELLIHSAKEKLGKEGCSYLSWGPVPLAKLGDMKGLSDSMQNIANMMYAPVKATLPDYETFHKKFGAQRREPLYVVFPKKFQLKSVRALIAVMQ